MGACLSYNFSGLIPNPSPEQAPEKGMIVQFNIECYQILVSEGCETENRSPDLPFPSGKGVAERRKGRISGYVRFRVLETPGIRISSLEFTPSSGAVSICYAEATAPFLPHWRNETVP